MSRDLLSLTGSFPVSTGASALALEGKNMVGRKKQAFHHLSSGPGLGMREIFGLFLPFFFSMEDLFSKCKNPDLGSWYFQPL